MTDFEIPHGTDRFFDLVIVDEEADPVDLTNAELKFVAKGWYSGAEPLFIKEIGTGIVIDDAPGGTAHVLIEAADTADLEFYRQVFKYEVLMTKSSRTEVVAKGDLIIVPSLAGES